MIILDETNGGFNGVTKGFYTTDLQGGKVVRRYYKALQGGYLVDDDKRNGNSDFSDETIIIFKNQGLVEPRAFLFGGPYNIFNSFGKVIGIEGYEGQRHRFLKSFMHVRNLEEFVLNYKDRSIKISIASVSRIFPYSQWAYTYKESFNALLDNFKKIYGDEDSVFFIDNKNRRSKNQILNKFDFKKRLNRVKKLWNAPSYFKPEEPLYAFLKPFLFLILQPSGKLEIYLYVFEPSFGILREYSQVVDFSVERIDAFCATSSELSHFSSQFAGIGLIKKDFKREVKYMRSGGGFNPRNKSVGFYVVYSDEEFFLHGEGVGRWTIHYLCGTGEVDSDYGVRSVGVEYFLGEPPYSNTYYTYAPAICAYKFLEFKGYENAGKIE